MNDINKFPFPLFFLLKVIMLPVGYTSIEIRKHHAELTLTKSGIPGYPMVSPGHFLQCYSSFRICLAGFPVLTGKPPPRLVVNNRGVSAAEVVSAPVHLPTAGEPRWSPSEDVWAVVPRCAEKLPLLPAAVDAASLPPPSAVRAPLGGSSSLLPSGSGPAARAAIVTLWRPPRPRPRP